MTESIFKSFAEMHNVYANADMSIQFEKASTHPILVDSDGWVTLEAAQRMHAELGQAIEAITAKKRGKKHEP